MAKDNHKMTDESPNSTATDKPVTKAKRSGPYSGTVIVVTGAFDVRKPTVVEEALNAFKVLAEAEGVTFKGEPRLVKINHRVGKSAEFTFEAD